MFKCIHICGINLGIWGMSRAAGELKSPLVTSGCQPLVGMLACGIPSCEALVGGYSKRALQELKSSDVDSPLPEAGSQRRVSHCGRVSTRLCLWVWLQRQCWYGTWFRHCVLVVQSRRHSVRLHASPYWAFA